MSFLRIDASTFRDDLIDGLIAAHGDVVRPVTGGVARVGNTPAGQVAVVIGGGSGHYPAFAGLVGRGLAHGAAMGDVFASPSAQQVYAVARAVATDAGVLLSYGNYAGDVLNFDQAQELLRADGIPCRTVVVTDDIASATLEQAELRRGIAGDFAVFRAAGWAAEQGRSLDEVWALADRANRNTRSLGVAFSGCTLPGADKPLFTVPAGRMAVGIGIHGEPGIDETDLPSPDELAALLVRRVLAEGAAGRVAVILNGLGSVKSEELFVIYARVAARLAEAGLTVVQPEVGELATSFEMAGVSLTVTRLDDELERAWTSPAGSAAYRRGAVTAAPAAPARSFVSATPVVATGSEESQAAANVVVRALRLITATIEGHVAELGRLDAIAGDGDHGIGMQRGSVAATAAADAACRAGGGARATLEAAARAWADKAGGTSGALWGLGLAAVATELSDDTAPTGRTVAAGVRAAASAIARSGRAQLGDKTMLDALIPFAERLTELTSAGVRLGEAWPVAAEVATAAARATADLPPRIGRARTHSTRSLGSPDPGAVSMALALTAVSPVLTTRKAAG